MAMDMDTVKLNYKITPFGEYGPFLFTNDLYWVAQQLSEGKTVCVKVDLSGTHYITMSEFIKYFRYAWNKCLQGGGRIIREWWSDYKDPAKFVSFEIVPTRRHS